MDFNKKKKSNRKNNNNNVRPLQFAIPRERKTTLVTTQRKLIRVGSRKKKKKEKET